MSTSSKHQKTTRIVRIAIATAVLITGVISGIFNTSPAFAGNGSGRESLITPDTAKPVVVIYQHRPTRYYRVRSGNSLWKIAEKYYDNGAAWKTISKANHISDPCLIKAGSKIRIPRKIGKTDKTVSCPSPYRFSSGAEDTVAAVPVVPPAEPALYYGAGSFQSCVIQAESGGNSQVMNSSGHYGLYQFSAGTWAAYGGNPNDFGNASVSEQNAVFNRAMAEGGQSNWAPYDGC